MYDYRYAELPSSSENFNDVRDDVCRIPAYLNEVSAPSDLDP